MREKIKKDNDEIYDMASEMILSDKKIDDGRTIASAFPEAALWAKAHQIKRIRKVDRNKRLSKAWMICVAPIKWLYNNSNGISKLIFIISAVLSTLVVIEILLN